MAQRNRPPDSLPPAVRDHPEVIKACAERDLGRLFRVINNLTTEPARFTATHIGNLCQMPTTRVQDYIRGNHRRPAIETITRVADGLRIPGAHFGLASRPWEQATRATAPQPGRVEDPRVERQDVERRRFLAAGGMAAANSVLPASRRVVQALDIVLSEGADTLGAAVDNLNELVGHYTEILPGAAPASVYDDLLGARSYAGTLLRRANASPRRADLLVAIGWLSNLLAVATSYLGDHGAALVWCADAERRSDESGHPELAGWAALSRSMIAYYQGRADRSADLARHGRPVAAAGSVINVKLAAQEMRASAMLGNAEGMAQARGRAVKALTRLPAEAARSGAFSIALAEEPPYTATSLLLLGRFDEAAAVTKDVIESGYPLSVRRRAEKSSSYARTLLILALAEAGRGRLSDALAAGRAALDGADVVWPTLVLAGKLDGVLVRDFDGAEEATEFRALYSEAARSAPHGPLASGIRPTRGN